MAEPRLFALFLLFLVAFASAEVSYEGYKVYRVNVASKSHAELLSSVADKLGLDIWKDVVAGDHADVMVSPLLAAEFRERMEVNRISYRVMIDNVQSLIGRFAPRKDVSPKNNPMDWVSYHELDTIYAFVDYVAG